MGRLFRFLKIVNLKTIYFNFKYFPFSQAIKLPVLVSKYVHLREVGGKVSLAFPIRHAVIQIGFGDISIFELQPIARYLGCAGARSV